MSKSPEKLAVCRVCGCTDDDCRQCIEKTGEPCRWVAPDLCSACAPEAGCVIHVDCRNGACTYTATGKWHEAQKIQARASCTSGAEWAARACAAKLLGIPAKDVVLQEKPKLQWDRPGFRQFTASKPQPMEDDEDE